MTPSQNTEILAKQACLFAGMDAARFVRNLRQMVSIPAHRVELQQLVEHDTLPEERRETILLALTH